MRRVRPMRISSPCKSSCSPFTRTNTPVREPRSVRTIVPACSSTMQCCSSTSGSFAKTRSATLRPHTTVVPRATTHAPSRSPCVDLHHAERGEPGRRRIEVRGARPRVDVRNRVVEDAGELIADDELVADPELDGVLIRTKTPHPPSTSSIRACRRATEGAPHAGGRSVPLRAARRRSHDRSRPRPPRGRTCRGQPTGRGRRGA